MARLIDAEQAWAKAQRIYSDPVLLHAIKNTLDVTETEDAAPVVHGWWKYGTRAAVCSECGFERHLDDNFGAAIACPNCGARMDGDGNA